jgi:hypothetical protein
MKRGYEYARQNGVKPLKKMVGKAGENAQRRAAAKERIGIEHLLIVLLLGIVIGGALSLSVVTPERLVALREKGSIF